MTEQTCANCGHVKEQHSQGVCFEKADCACKKFKPKTEGDKTLSDKIWNLIEYCDECEKSGEEVKDLLSKKDVKNFIKKLKEELHTYMIDEEMHERIDKLAGENLI